jgi:hypothetical protein
MHQKIDLLRLFALAQTPVPLESERMSNPLYRATGLRGELE